MALVIVLPNRDHLTTANDLGAGMVMAERVDPIHLEDAHSSEQFLERLCEAIEDAEAVPSR